MISLSILTKLFGDYSQKEIKRIKPLCDKVLGLEKEYAKLSDAELRAKTQEFKDRYENGESLDSICPALPYAVRPHGVCLI